MNESEQASKQLPIDNDIVVKLLPASRYGTSIAVNGNKILEATANSPTYSSTKEMDDKIATPIRNYCTPVEFFRDGLAAEILEPGKKWIKGKIRLRLVMEFLPDEPEDNKATGDFVSSLDDIRNIKL